MKSIFNIIILISLIIQYVNGQEAVTKLYPTNQFTTIKVDIDYGDIEVKFADVKELKITYDIKINGERHNDAFDIRERKRNNILSVKSTLDFDDIESRVTLRDANGNLTIMSSEEWEKRDKSSKGWNSMSYGHDIDGKILITIPKGKSIKLKSTYGDMDIVYNDITKNHKLEFYSIYGHVDLSIPASTATDLMLQTSYGEIYTDHKFEVEASEKKKNCGMGEKIVTFLNQKNGQGSIALEATYSNIYLRKT